MELYLNYAEKLLNLHQYHHQLVLKDFGPAMFYREIYEAQNQVESNGISYNNVQSGGVNRYFPAVPIYTNFSGEVFSIEYRSYSGLIGKNTANKVECFLQDDKQKNKLKKDDGEYWRGKHGLFDFYINTGNRYQRLYKGDATHYNLFLDLYKYTNLEQCYRVWAGSEDIIEIENLDIENAYEALLTLSLMMFEQEVNYGQKIFQQATNFKIKDGYRPRDMLMGFIKMMFEDKRLFDSYPYWNSTYNRASPHFGWGKEQGYANLGEEYKIYFTCFKGTHPYVYPLLGNPEISGKFDAQRRLASQNPAILLLDATATES